MASRHLLVLTVLCLILPVVGTSAVIESQSASAHLKSALNTSSFTAQRPPDARPDEEPDGAQGPPWVNEINLTTEQKTRIKAIHDKSKSATQSLRQQLQQAEDQERSLMTGNTNADQIKTSISRFNAFAKNLMTNILKQCSQFETFLPQSSVLELQP